MKAESVTSMASKSSDHEVDVEDLVQTGKRYRKIRKGLHILQEVRIGCIMMIPC